MVFYSSYTKVICQQLEYLLIKAQLEIVFNPFILTVNVVSMQHPQNKLFPVIVYITAARNTGLSLFIFIYLFIYFSSQRFRSQSYRGLVYSQDFPHGRKPCCKALTAETPSINAEKTSPYRTFMMLRKLFGCVFLFFVFFFKCFDPEE